MCVADAASTMFRTVIVFFSLLSPSFSFCKFTSTETASLKKICVCDSHLPSSWRLLQPITRIERCVFQGLRRFATHLRVSKELLKFSCSLDVLPHLHKDIVSVAPLFSVQIGEKSKWVSMSFRRLTNTITSCFCCSLKRFMEARMSKRRHCSHRRRLSSSKCSCRIELFLLDLKRFPGGQSRCLGRCWFLRVSICAFFCR